MKIKINGTDKMLFRAFYNLVENGANIKIVIPKGNITVDVAMSIAILSNLSKLDISEKTVVNKSIDADYVLDFTDRQLVLGSEEVEFSWVSLVWNWVKDFLAYPQELEGVPINSRYWGIIKQNLVDPIGNSTIYHEMDPLTFVLSSGRVPNNSPILMKDNLDVIRTSSKLFEDVLQGAMDGTEQELEFIELPKIQVKTSGRNALVRVNDNYLNSIGYYKDYDDDALLSYVKVDDQLIWELHIKHPRLFSMKGDLMIKSMDSSSSIGYFESKEDALSSIDWISPFILNEYRKEDSGAVIFTEKDGCGGYDVIENTKSIIDKFFNKDETIIALCGSGDLATLRSHENDLIDELYCGQGNLIAPQTYKWVNINPFEDIEER